MVKIILSLYCVVFCTFFPIIAHANAVGDPNDADKPEESKISQIYDYPAYTGPKKRIAVTSFDNKVQEVRGNRNIGEGMAEMLTTELIKTGRFVVVERQALDNVASEQKLGQSGMVQKETAAKIGQILGAQIVIRGVVSEFEQTAAKSGGGLNLGFLNVGGGKSSAHVAVDIRMIDTSTGQVLYSHNAAGTAEASSTKIGVNIQGVSFNGDDFKKTPIGQATRDAIHDAVRFIIDSMENVPFSAKIIKVDPKGKIFINAGSVANIQPGATFGVFSEGEKLVDPDSGLVLGSEETKIGVVEIKSVQDNFSVGSCSSKGKLKKGDILRLE